MQKIGRPEPTIVAEHTNAAGITEQIMQGEDVWIVTYRNKPIGIKAIGSEYAPRYKKTMFTRKAPAANLATRLNTLYKTQDFSVRNLAI